MFCLLHGGTRLVSPFRCVGRAPRSADTHRMRGCLRHSHPNAALFQVLLCLPTAPGLPLQGNGDFGTSAFFGQLSDKPLLACIWSVGVRAPKRNGWSKIKRWAPSWRIAVVQLINWLGGRSSEAVRVQSSRFGHLGGGGAGSVPRASGCFNC